MHVAVIGTGFVGGIIGRKLAHAGHTVTFGSRHPEDDDVAGASTASVASVAEALGAAETLILALPGPAVGGLTSAHEGVLSGKLVIDATNRMGEAVSNSRSALPPSVRYARAFNTLGGENLESPEFAEGMADMFFSAPEADRPTVEAIVGGVGLRAIYLGPDEEELMDSLFRLWIALAVKQGRGRRIAFRLMEKKGP